MIKFIIEKIQLRNVRNYGDTITEMDFPLDNLTVFTGHVGAGKSTILKSVSMALYGDDGGVKGEKLSIDDMVNERTGKNLEIHLFMKAVDDVASTTNNYEIHLYHKHSKMQNKLVFMKDGVDISANGKMDTYRLIEKTLIPKQVYHNIYYFTQQAKNFFTALPNSEQKEIFDSILDLSEYDIYYANCRKNISEYEQLISECELKIKMIENNIHEKEVMIENEKKQIETLIELNKSEVENLKNQINDLKKKLDSLQSNSILGITSKDITESIHKLESETQIKLNNLTNEISNFENQITAIKDKYQKLFLEEKTKQKENLDSLNNPIKEENHQLELKEFDVTHQRSAEITENESKEEAEKVSIDNKYKEKQTKIEQSIKDFERDLLDYQSKVKSDYLAKQNEINSEIAAIKDSVMKLELKKKEESSSKQTYERKLSDYQKTYVDNMKQLTSDTPICDKCGQPLINLDRLKAEQADLEEKIDDLKKKISECSNSIVLVDKEIEKVNSDIKSKQDELSDYKTKIVNEYNTKKSEVETKISELKVSLTQIEKSKKSEIDSIIQRYQSLKSDIQSKYSKILDDIHETITSNNSKIEFNTNEIKNKLILVSQEFNKKIADECTGVKTSIDNKTNEKSKLNSDYQNSMASLKNQLSNALSDEQNLESLKTVISQKESELKVKSEFVASDETLKSLEKLVSEDKTRHSTLIEKKKELDKTLKILEFWKVAFSDSGIKSMLIDVAIPHMNRCVRDELDRVCPGTFTVSFDTLSTTKGGDIRDKFSINIIHNLKCATGHKKLSGGEKRIIDFCCMAALRSLAEKLYGKMFCHIFYDEVLDSLDSESRELFCRSMKQQSSDHRNITLVTHALAEDVEPDRVFPF